MPQTCHSCIIVFSLQCQDKTTQDTALPKNDRDGICLHEFTFGHRRHAIIIGKVTPKLPEWHIWPEGDAFVFADEIYIN